MNNTLACQTALQLAETITDDQIRQATHVAMTNDQIAAVRSGIAKAIGTMSDDDIDTFATDPRPQPRLLAMNDILQTAVQAVLQSV